MLEVSPNLIELTVRLAEQRGQAVADVPISTIAAAAGVSRSTLVRQLGGTRAALDEAVRAAGIEPGGRTPVRERAVRAAADLIAEHGLGSVTLAAVAQSANCSLPALHAAFDGRDSLLAAVFDRYSPLLDLIVLAADPPDSLEILVRRIHRTLIEVFGREPRVVPALLGDLFSRPTGPAAELMRANLPRVADAMSTLFGPYLRSGVLRPLPLPLLIQLLFAPIALHLVLRPGIGPAIPLPSVDETVDLFTAAFLCAVATEPTGS